MVKCELCGKELKTTQGLAGHMRLAHAEQEAPALVKPAQPADLLAEALGEGELADYTETSPCCAARLRSAVRVLGIADRALKGCFICARCGEWYLYEPEGYLAVYKDSSGALSAGVSHLQHLLPETNPEPSSELGSVFKQS